MSKEEKSYIGKDKNLIIQQPLSWGAVRDVLRSAFEVEETDSGRVIIEEKVAEKE